MQGARDGGYLLEIAEDFLVPIDVGFENLPVVDAGLPRRAGICKYETGVDLFRSDRDRLAVDAVGLEMNGAGAAVESRVVVLAPSRDADELGFDVLRDHADLFQSKFMSHEACESGGGGDH